MQAVVRTYRAELLVPYVVLTECAFLFGRRRTGYGVPDFLATMSELQCAFVETNRNDLYRATEIALQYKDNEFDFVDVCIMAMAERLNIMYIATTDVRDFTAYRPRHVEYFTLIGAV